MNFFKQALIAFFITIILAVHETKAENAPQYIPQAPEAQAMARAIDIPVSYYTGLPNISIPLYTIEVGGISVPISLSYQGGGIKPSQEATSVGLGWSLNAGGSITRTVKSGDDFNEFKNRGKDNGFLDFANKEWPLFNDHNFENSNYTRWTIPNSDTEPDIFFYSFPAGGGKFSYRSSGDIVYYDKSSNVQVQYKGGFELLDAQGNQYLFEEQEQTYTHSSSVQLLDNKRKDGDDIPLKYYDVKNPSVHTSSWLLTKIVSVTGDEVCFEYKDEAYQLPAQMNGFKKEVLGGITKHDELFTSTISSSKSYVYGKKLSRISWKSGHVEFLHGNREDFYDDYNNDFNFGVTAENRPKKVTAVKVYDQDNRLICHWAFKYGYFNDDETGKKAYLFKRLRLDEVTNVLACQAPYRFSYNEEVKLPAKNTKNTDFWGYYNGSEQGDDFYSPSPIAGKGKYSNGNKVANETYCKMGILEDIQNPTGGHTHLYWGINKVGEPLNDGDYCPEMPTTPIYEVIAKFRPTEPITKDFKVRKKCCVWIHTSICGKTVFDYVQNDLNNPPFSIFKKNASGEYVAIRSWYLSKFSNVENNMMLEPGDYRIRCNPQGISDHAYTMIVKEYEPEDNAFNCLVDSVTHGSLYAYKGDAYSYADTPEETSDTIAIFYNTRAYIDLEYLNLGRWGLPQNDFPRIPDLPSFQIFTEAADGTLTKLVFSMYNEGRDDRGTEADIPGSQVYKYESVDLSAGRYRFVCYSHHEDIQMGAFYSYSTPIQLSLYNSYKGLTGKQRYACGGLRIDSIGGEKKVRFSYEDGKEIVPLKMWGIGDELTKLKNEAATNRFRSAVVLKRYSDPVVPFTSMNNGFSVGYTRVIEDRADGTQIVYAYHNETEAYQDPGTQTSQTFTDWENGLLLSQITIAGNGDTISTIRNEYTKDFQTGEYECGVYSNPSVDGWDYLHYYYNNVVWPKIVRQEITEYYPEGKLQTEKTFKYNERLLCSEERTQLATDVYTVIYKYVTDFADSFSKRMELANMVGTPVAQFSSRNGTVYSGSKTVYGDFNGKLLPSILLTLNTDKASTDVSQCKFDTSVVFKNYTKYGNPQELDFRGTPVSYLWEYKGMYPVAEYKNATYETLSSCGMNVREEDVIDDFHVSDSRVSALRHLTGNKEPIAVTTCRYRPLVGVTEITAPTGLSQTFRYDEAGRLSQILFGKSELHNVFRYHYADEADTDNYVESIEYLNAEKTDSIGTVQYYDIWGRKTIMSEFGVNTSRKNLWSLITYDKMGRLDKSWTALPNKDRLTEENFADASNSFFGDAYAYSQTTYDALGRTLKVTTPGKKWHDENKATENSYNTNGYQKVRKYKVIGDAMTDAGYYGRNTLTCTTLKDPDGNMSSTYKDMFGNVVLERRGGDHDTYYVYDDYNRLRFVLSPKYQDEASLDKFAYEYRYDGRGNVIYKKLPGCKPIEYEYDKADRVIKMQDGLLRAKGKYRVYEYDGLGRLKKQSIADSIHVEYDELVNFYDNYDYLDEYSDLIPENKVDETDLSPLLHHSGIGLLTGVLQRASNGELLLMSYSYDDHGRVVLTKEIGLDKHLAAMGYSYNFAGDLDYDAGDLYRYDKSVGKLNDNSLYSWTKHYFHESNNKLPYRSVIHLTHKGSTKQTKDEIKGQVYDDFGRVIANDHKGTAGDMTFAYDNLHGWLKQIGSASGFSQTLFRETGADNPRWNGSISAMTWNVGDFVDRTYNFTYDGLNRLISADYSSNINASGSAFADPEHRGLLPWDCLQENYSESFRYDKNCNITFVERMGTTNTQKGQEIDVLALEYNGNQLKNVCDYSGINLTYSGAFDFVDREDLAQEYAYNENGAMTKDLNKDITNIEYDLLGNPRKVTMTNNRSIEYVYAADGRKLRTVHSAPVARLPRDTESKAVVGKGKGIPKPRITIRKTTTDYINNYVFKNGKPEMYRFPGGYYSFDEEGKMDGCHFYVQDYQGNNRMVVNAYTDSIEQISHYYPYGALMGDISTQPEAQDFKYSGKELDRTYGLDLYDFHARQYDPLIPGFNSMDPESEHFYGYSPYSYCGGDPINRTDKTGEFFDVIWDIANVAMDVTSAIDNFSNGNVVSGLIDVGACIADVGAAIVPCVPGGVGAALKASRAADKVLDATKALDKASDAVKTADNVTDAVKATDKTTDALSAMKRGKESEARVLDDMGLTKNTKSQRVNVKGKDVTTIPDAETATAVYEIKDAKNVYNTKQIQAERIHAQKNGKQFFIIVGENTHVSKKIPENEIIRRSDLGPR